MKPISRNSYDVHIASVLLPRLYVYTYKQEYTAT